MARRARRAVTPAAAAYSPARHVDREVRDRAHRDRARECVSEAELAAYVEPEPGVPAVVARLAADRRVAIVSNGGAAQRDKLERAGLADLVPTMFISGELGVAKPAPAMLECALAWSELAPAECLFVGDDPMTDLVPAAALGMGTAWRTRDHWPQGVAAPQFTIESLDELEAWA